MISPKLATITQLQTIQPLLFPFFHFYLPSPSAAAPPAADQPAQMEPYDGEPAMQQRKGVRCPIVIMCIFSNVEIILLQISCDRNDCNKSKLSSHLTVWQNQVLILMNNNHISIVLIVQHNQLSEGVTVQQNGKWTPMLWKPVYLVAHNTRYSLPPCEGVQDIRTLSCHSPGLLGDTLQVRGDWLGGGGRSPALHELRFLFCCEH